MLSRQRVALWALWASFTAMGLPAEFAAAQPNALDTPAAEEVPPPGTGRLWNLTSEPFHYRLRRASGPSWTEQRVIAPGEYAEFSAAAFDQDDLLGVDLKNPFIVVEHRELGGVVRMRLSSRTLHGDRLPNWFYVKDANNFGRLVQSTSVAQAQRMQAQMQEQKPLSAEEVDTVRKMLRANWVYYPANVY